MVSPGLASEAELRGTVSPRQRQAHGVVFTAFPESCLLPDAPRHSAETGYLLQSFITLQASSGFQLTIPQYHAAGAFLKTPFKPRIQIPLNNQE